MDENISEEIVMNEDADTDADANVVSDLEFIAATASIEVIPWERQSTDTANKPIIVSHNIQGNQKRVIQSIDESSDSEDNSDDDSDASNTVTKAAVITDWLTEEEAAQIPVGPPRTKNETDELVIEDWTNIVINPAVDGLEIIGKVASRIDSENTVIVEGIISNYPLNEGSLLCCKDGALIGRVHEIFGPVSKPFYIVKWSAKLHTSNDSVYKSISSIALGVDIYCVKDHSSYVTPQTIKQISQKGSDASNIFDEEIAPEDQEYSDDELELLAKQARNRSKHSLSTDTSGRTAKNVTNVVKSTSGQSNNVQNGNNNTVNTVHLSPLPPFSQHANYNPTMIPMHQTTGMNGGWTSAYPQVPYQQCSYVQMPQHMPLQGYMPTHQQFPQHFGYGVQGVQNNLNGLHTLAPPNYSMPWTGFNQYPPLSNPNISDHKPGSE